MSTYNRNKKLCSQLNIGNYTQIIAICLGTRCPPRDPSLLVSCSPVPHHVIPEGPLEEHNSFKSEMKICFADSPSTIDGDEFGFVGTDAILD